MKALVIGATGIIGNHIVRALLAEGIEVRAFSRGITPSINLEGLDVEWIKGDLEIQADVSRAVKGCAWVFHAASYYPNHPFRLGEHVARAKRGIDSVLNGVSDHSIDRLVYTSSLTTIGRPHYFGQLADESCPYDLIQNPPHPYFAVKFLMEEEVKERSKNIPAVIVNPTGCQGPYELKPKNLCLIPQVLSGRLPFYIEGNLNIVDTADVAKGHLLAAQKGKIGERYLLGGPNFKVSDLLQLVCRLGKKKGPLIRLPLWTALSAGWTSEWVCYTLLNRPSFLPLLGLRFIEYGQHFNLTKAQNELGYRFSPLEGCLLKAIEWFKKIKYL